MERVEDETPVLRHWDDLERSHVERAISDYDSTGRSDEPLPTEFLQEDSSAALVISAHEASPGRVAMLVSHRPLLTLLSFLALSLLCTLILAVGGC